MEVSDIFYWLINCKLIIILDDLCFKQKETVKGRQQVLEGEIVSFRRDLKEDMFKDAEQKYKDKMIALRVRPLECFYQILLHSYA